MNINAYLVFDVETPNSKQDKICQLGAVHYLPGTKAQDINALSFLVNPETHFDERCCEVHGIHAMDVLDKPTFRQLWDQELSSLFSTSVLVAHNANFDLSVLLKTLSWYDLELPEILFIDTLELSRRFYPSLPNHKLPTVSDYLGYRVSQHHDAASDALATFHILNETYKQFGGDTLPIRRFEKSFTKKQDMVGSLKHILEEIKMDGRVTFAEAAQLAVWLRENRTDLPVQLCEELHQMLFEVLYDGIIDSSEEEHMIAVIDRILHPAQETQEIPFNDKTFVLTGDFAHGTKTDIAQLIEDRGGIILKSVTKKTDYVVIGGYGSDKYSNGTYGTKVKKARELQEKGSGILIVGESALFAQETITH